MAKHLLPLSMSAVLAVAGSAWPACSGGNATPPGALVSVSMQSQVGVVLDEVPASMRDRVAQSLIAQPAKFWQDRAQSQIKLTTVRLVFRLNYYPDMGKQSLPLPPSAAWHIALTKAGGAASTPNRAMVDGHDVVLVDYTLSSTLLTDADSPGKSEPALKDVGGTWDEDFTLPIDPELVFQRTGYACMDEGEFPPNSVDSEEVDSFYDDSCDVEAMTSKTGCHREALPTMSCVDAVKAKIGAVTPTLHFARLAWDSAMADKVRIGTVTNSTGADLQVVEDEFHVNRITYRYITPDSCTLAEKCVGGTGWRRLLQFSTADVNTGTKALDIGPVDYFMMNGGSLLSQHGLYEYSACHEHYHFTHYGSFSYGSSAATTTKRGFCLQSTDRFENSEYSPLWNPYYDCSYQGVSVGWADEYKAGLECQWIDVTGIDVSKGPVTDPLKFVSNPDGFLCEGTPVLDAQGNQTFLPTTFKTSTGQAVDKPACTYYSQWFANNTDSYNVTMPAQGEGYVTAPCTRGQIGPLRNCGFTRKADLLRCTPGAQVTLHCTLPAGSAPQSVRLCESSAVLQSGTACTQQAALASVAVDQQADIPFTCPASRDASEPGGLYSLYASPVFDGDAAQTPTCVAR